MKIIIDSREQRPFDFLSQNGDIETERGTLDTGDYSVAGLESRVAVERKSLADLVTWGIPFPPLPGLCHGVGYGLHCTASRPLPLCREQGESGGRDSPFPPAICEGQGT